MPRRCLQAHWLAPQALGCVSEVTAYPCPALPPRCPHQAEPLGPRTAPAPTLYIAPARPPPAGQVACGFVFLLPSRRRLCLHLSLSRTPHCPGVRGCSSQHPCPEHPQCQKCWWAGSLVCSRGMLGACAPAACSQPGYFIQELGGGLWHPPAPAALPRWPSTHGKPGEEGAGAARCTGGRCSCPLPPQEQGRAVAASRSLPQLPSVLFIEQVLAWWPLFNSKAFKRGTNREILPLAWRTATVLMDFFKTTLGLGASPSPSAFAVCIRAGTVTP